MARDIKLDQIRARLGDLDKPRSYDPYNTDDNHDFVGSSDSETDGGSTLNAGFIATILGLFLMVSGGTYMFSSGFNPLGMLNWRPSASTSAEFVSKVDPFCKPLWKSPGWNGDALACYMIEIPSRFCDANERQHLVKLFRKYRMDIRTLQSQAIAQITVGQKEIFDSIAKDFDDHEKGIVRKKPKSKPVPKNKYLSNKTFEQSVMAFQTKVMNPGSAGKDPELSAILRNVMVRGYIDPSEFGLLRDEIVSDALLEPLPERISPCVKTAS